MQAPFHQLPVARKEIVLGLAHKEGGAHVDADIDERYKAVMESKFVHLKINEVNVGALNISRLVAGLAGAQLIDCIERNLGSGTTGP